jgi:hypothetical protein
MRGCYAHVLAEAQEFLFRESFADVSLSRLEFCGPLDDPLESGAVKSGAGWN